MRVKPNELLYCLRAVNLEKGQVAKFKMSKLTRDIYHALSMNGFFPDLLLAREYKSGWCYFVKMR